MQPFWFNSAKQNPYSKGPLPVPPALQGPVPTHGFQAGSHLIRGQFHQPGALKCTDEAFGPHIMPTVRQGLKTLFIRRFWIAFTLPVLTIFT